LFVPIVPGFIPLQPKFLWLATANFVSVLRESENCRRRQKRRPASANVRTFLAQRKKNFDENREG
jgi:hypothetical protein